MADISATTRDHQNAIRSRENSLQTSNVNWASLAAHDTKIEGYEKGLARLKSYRNCYFPNWQELTTAE